MKKACFEKSRTTIGRNSSNAIDLKSGSNDGASYLWQKSMQSCNIAKQKICFDHKNLLFRAKLQSENDVDLGWTLQPNLTTFCPAEAKYFALCMLFSWRKLKFAYLRQNQFVLPAWIWENYFEFVHIFVLPMQNNYEFVCIFFCIHVHVFWCFKEVETFVCIPDSTGSL